jgi:hypothetical protein
MPFSTSCQTPLCSFANLGVKNSAATPRRLARGRDSDANQECLCDQACVTSTSVAGAWSRRGRALKATAKFNNGIDQHHTTV